MPRHLPTIHAHLPAHTSTGQCRSCSSASRRLSPSRCWCGRCRSTCVRGVARMTDRTRCGMAGGLESCKTGFKIKDIREPRELDKASGAAGVEDDPEPAHELCGSADGSDQVRHGAMIAVVFLCIHSHRSVFGLRPVNGQFSAKLRLVSSAQSWNVSFLTSCCLLSPTQELKSPSIPLLPPTTTFPPQTHIRVFPGHHQPRLCHQQPLCSPLLLPTN